jgi:hypothetical protein
MSLPLMPKSAIGLIMARREKQIAKGYTAAHDDEHEGDLTKAADCFLHVGRMLARTDEQKFGAVRRYLERQGIDPETDEDFQREVADPYRAHFGRNSDGSPKLPAGAWHEWPWEAEAWNPSNDPIDNLVDAAALVVAEIERLMRRDGVEVCLGRKSCDHDVDPAHEPLTLVRTEP